MSPRLARLAAGAFAFCFALAVPVAFAATTEPLALDEGRLTTYWRETDFRDARPSYVFPARDGSVWLAAEGAVIQYDGWTWRSHGSESPLAAGVIKEIVQSRDGTIWMATNTGLTIWREGDVHRLTAAEGLPGSEVQAIVEDRQGQMWVGTDNGIARVRLDGSGRPSAQTEDTLLLAPQTARGLLGPDGSLWFMIWHRDPVSSSLLRYDGKAWWLFEPDRPAPENLPHKCLHNFAFGAEGNLLVTSCQQLHRYDGKQWHTLATFPSRETRKDDNRILAAHDDSIWIYDLGLSASGAKNVALVRVKNGVRTDLGIPGAQYVSSLVECPDGSLLAGTDNGVKRFSEEQWKPWPTGSRLDQSLVEQIVAAPDGALWFRTSAAVYRYGHEPGAVLIQPAGQWPTELRKTAVRLDLGVKSRWSRPERLSVAITLDGKRIAEQTADKAIFLEGLSQGSHVLEVAGVGAEAGKHIQPLIHPFRVHLALHQRGDILLILLVSIVFIAAPSVTLAYFKHRRLRESLGNLHMANQRLQEADQLKSDFVANVSHELRTPLTAIKGFVDNLLDGIGGTITEKQARSLQRIKSNADRLGRLIADLLDIRRIESGRLELRPMEIKLQDVAAMTLEALQSRAEERQIEMGLTVEGECPPVWADRDRIAQIYTNIIGNALKFTPGGGTIRVVVRPEGDGRIYTAIQDTGPGIAPEEQSRIFDRFYQVARGVTGKTTGTGLGLAICKDLIELQDGSIGVESTPGEGSIFYFSLPTADAARRGSAHA